MLYDSEFPLALQAKTHSVYPPELLNLLPTLVYLQMNPTARYLQILPPYISLSTPPVHPAPQQWILLPSNLIEYTLFKYLLFI
jgi:hypothetical protein